MCEKITKILFLICFFLMILIPVSKIRFGASGTVSLEEKRKLADFPSLITEEGKINTEFTSLFDEWINDNIGYRESLVQLDSLIRYYGFDTLAKNGNYVFGPNGELNYATDSIVKSYQHLDLRTQDELDEMAEGFQAVYEYLKERDIQMYYYQCWDKQSIYPEQFPATVIQHGDISKTDQIVSNLSQNTDIPVISPKQALINGKEKYETYGRWNDVTHWTQRGAFIGYTELMKVINENNNGKYKVLTEEDYEISKTDQGKTLYGIVHVSEELENFVMKNPTATLTDETPKWAPSSGSVSKYIFINDTVDNDDTLLILGDSYFDEFLYDDLAESFHKVVQIWGNYTSKFKKIIEEYSPTIVIVENAERADRTDKLTSVGLKIAKE